MLQLFEFLQQYSDYVIIGLLLVMSVIMLAAVIERFIFLKRVDVAKYSNIHALEIDLNRNMTVISTVGANAPYVGLLGTVIGILLTFFQIGHGDGEVDDYDAPFSCIKSNRTWYFSRYSVYDVL